MFQATTGHGQRPCLGPMIASQVTVDPWRSAKLGHRDHQRMFQHASLMQIFDDRGKSPVELRHQTEVRVEVIAMRIPAVRSHFDERDSRFEHSPSHQHMPTEVGRAVTFDIFGRKGSGVEQISAFLQLGGHLVDVGVGLGIRFGSPLRVRAIGKLTQLIALFIVLSDIQSGRSKFSGGLPSPGANDPYFAGRNPASCGMKPPLPGLIQM